MSLAYLSARDVVRDGRMARRVFLAAVVFLAVASIALADDNERIEGIVAAVHQNDLVLIESDKRQIAVSISSPGGVAATIAPGAADCGHREDGARRRKFIASRLESTINGR